MQEETQKIDLHKIANILNGSDTYIDKTIEQRIISINCLEATSNDINIDKHDLCRALSFKGNIAGFVGSEPLTKNIHEDVITNVGLKNFQKAKSILITFIFNEKASMLMRLSSLMSEIDSLVSNKCEVVYGTETNNSLDVNTIAYKILLTGIESTKTNLSELESEYKKTLIKSKELETKYERLLKEHNELKNLNKRMELSLLSLRNH
jgi:cell division GTPase FtsZ